MKYKRYSSYKDSGNGWLGEIPSHWLSVRLKSILNERKESNKPIKTKNILSLCMYRGVIPYSEKGNSGNKAKDDLTAYKLAYPNDIVLNSMNVVAGSVGLSKYFGAVSPVYYMLNVRKELDNINYFNGIFQSETFQKSLFGLGNGILVKQSESTGKLNTIRMKIPMDKLNNVVLPYPSVQEQISIANYLDKATTKIDTLIEKQTKLIELLKEKRQAVISSAVTRGLDASVPMKDSGVEWLGEIPEHWEIKKGKFIFEEKNRPVRKSDGIVTVFRDGQVILRSKRRLTGFTMAILEHGYQGIRKGDLVIHSMDAFAGAIGVSEDDGRSTPEYVVVKPLISNCSEEYYADQLRLMAQRGFIYILCPSVRERAPRYRFSKFSETHLVFPPNNEQQNITEQIELSNLKIDKLVSKSEAFIDLLKEKRTALISAAVTGKIDVRDAA